MNEEQKKNSYSPDAHELAQALTRRKTSSGGVRKIYREEADALKEAALKADLELKTRALMNAAKESKVDFSNMDDVKRRTHAYLNACSESATFPSVQGLAAFAFGVSRQAVYAHTHAHPNSEFTMFFNLVRDLIADVIANAALRRNADSVMSIFLLKNNHGFSDRVEIEPVQRENDRDNIDLNEIARRYMIEDDNENIYGGDTNEHEE